MTDLARFTVDRRDELVVLRVEGEVDISNASEMAGAMDRASEGGGPVVLDLSETTYMDSAGIRLVFALAERLRSRRRGVRLIVPESSPIRSVLEITGVPQLVPLEPSLEGTPPPHAG